MCNTENTQNVKFQSKRLQKPKLITQEHSTISWTYAAIQVLMRSTNFIKSNHNIHRMWNMLVKLMSMPPDYTVSAVEHLKSRTNSECRMSRHIIKIQNPSDSQGYAYQLDDAMNDSHSCIK